MTKRTLLQNIITKATRLQAKPGIESADIDEELEDVDTKLGFALAVVEGDPPCDTQ